MVGLLALAVFYNPLPVHAGASEETNGDLFEMDIEELMSMEISVASKKNEKQYEAPGVVSVIPRNEIEIYGDRTLHQLMQRQTSVYTLGSYFYPHNIASFRGDMAGHLDLHTLLLINGRPLRDSYYGGENFPIYMTYPLESVSSVEVIRGPGSVLYGSNAFTGLVNLKSRSIPEKTQFSVFSMAGTEGLWDTTVSGGGKAGALGFVTDNRFSGQQGYGFSMYDGRPAGAVYKSDHDTNRNIATMNHFEFYGFTLDLFYSNLETFYMGVVPYWNFSDNILRTNTGFGNLGYMLPLHDRLKLEFNLTYNYRSMDFQRPVKSEADVISEDWLGEITAYVNPTDNLNITLGYLQEYQKSVMGDNTNTTVDPPYNLEPQSAYAQADYRLNKVVKLIGGLQWNKAAYGSTDTIMRTGVILTPFEKWGFKLLRGEAFRAPYAIETSLYDTTILVGNKNLSPETVATYDAQIFYNDDKTYAALTYFDTQIEDLIIRDNSTTPASFKNGGQQDFDGIELEYKHFFNKQWHVLGSYTYQDSTQTSELNPSTVPHNMFKAGTAYTWDWGSAALFYTFFSEPPRLATEVIRNPAPDTVNLISANLRIDLSHFQNIPRGRTTLILRGENLANKDIWTPEFNRGGVPNTLPQSGGATFYAGLEMRF